VRWENRVYSPAPIKKVRETISTKTNQVWWYMTAMWEAELRDFAWGQKGKTI
jgi:hypothetical protein